MTVGWRLISMKLHDIKSSGFAVTIDGFSINIDKYANRFWPVNPFNDFLGMMCINKARATGVLNESQIIHPLPAQNRASASEVIPQIFTLQDIKIEGFFHESCG